MSQVIRYPRPPALADLGTRHAVVEASAGTGKTYLLEHLVVDLLLRRGATIEEILVVTFTERATSELCVRLREKLTELLYVSADDPKVRAAADGPDQDCWIIDQDARDRLRVALLAFDRATVSTIHGFCRGILADHAFLNSRLFDEQAVDEEGSFHEAFVETLRQDFSVNPALLPYLRAWLEGGGDAKSLEKALLVCSKELARVFPADAATLQPAFDESALNAALALWPDEASADDTLAPKLKSAGVNGRSVKAVAKRLVELAELITTHGRSPADFLAGLQGLESEWDDYGFDYFLKNLADAAKNPLAVRLRAAVQAIQEARVPLLAALAPKFLPVVQARLRTRKRVAGLYDFQDMLNLVAERLADTDASSRLLLSTLRQRYRYALIDEFQDTDDVQWFIFRRIFFESRAHVLTVIGDPKQAIYRFRGADVHTYLRARQEILQADGAQVRLNENFRSTQAVVDGNNAIFAESTGFFRPGTGIEYRQPVTCGCPTRVLRDAHDRPAPGVVILDVGPEGKAGEIRRALRRQMVDEIGRMLRPEGRLFVPDRPDPEIHAGNIFVLAFTHNECREVGDSLGDAGIAHAFFRQDKLFNTPEAADILDLLRALTEPEDPRLRARALLTKFFALDLPDLPLVNRPDLASPALEHLFTWHRMAQDGDFGALFATIIAGSGIACREVCLATSERSLTNTLHIFEVLQDEAARTHANLRELSEMLGGFINGTRLPPGEERDLQRLESDASAVQIMTVHAAKGLEADVVFLYGGVERRSQPLPYVFHDQQGRRVVNLGLLTAQEESLLSQEHSDEDRRLLYVALTRARARLYIPLYPQGRSGLCAGMAPILDRVLTDPATRSLYQRVAIACPGEAPLILPAPEPAALADWQPPSPPVAVPDENFHKIARERAGFFITSYTGVKRRHGGFVVAEGPAETGTAVVDQNAPQPVLPGELERGRLSGIFLHAIIEELPLDLAATMEAQAWLEHRELSPLLDRLARQHERDPRQLAHAVRMVHAALFSTLRLGAHTVPGLGRQRPFLRETEFLYPIPEKHHPLLGLPQDGRSWSVERGLVKGFIDVLFQHEGRVFLCDWKGDWLPSWEQAHLDQHCQKNYDVQARLYTLAVLRMTGVRDRTAYDDRFGGILYCFLRGLRPDAPDAGIVFRRPEWDTVLAWQDEMLSGQFWGLS